MSGFVLSAIRTAPSPPSASAIDGAAQSLMFGEPGFWIFPVMVAVALVSFAIWQVRRERRWQASGIGRYQRTRDTWTWEYDFRNGTLRCPDLMRSIGMPPAQSIPIAAVLRRHIPQDDWRRLREIAGSFFSGQQMVDVALRLRTHAGEIRWVHWQGGVVQVDANGKALLAAGTCRDVTLETTAEFQLRLAEQVMDSSSDAVVVVDRNFCLVNVNRRFSEVTGFAPGEVLGRPLNAFCVGEELSWAGAEAYQALLARGNWDGEQWILRQDGQKFLARTRVNRIHDALSASTHYVCLFSDVTERRRAEEKLRFLSTHDALTGLLNHVALQERLGQLIDTARFLGTSAAVLFLELHNFKQLNDSLGHRLGDEVVRTVARRLVTVAGTDDIVARHGGAEFVVVLTHTRGREDAAAAAQALLDAFRADLTINGMDIAVTPAIGISLFPGDGVSADQLLGHADLAMTQARKQLHARYAFYESAMSATARGELRRESQLRHALEEQQFDLHYQPIVDVSTGLTSGVEALLRWRNPDAGLLMPGEFIHLAEDRGLISDIGRWVLRQACHDVMRLNLEAKCAMHLGVNVSSPQLSDPAFVEDVEAALTGSGLDPGQLRLELTESVIMDGNWQVQRVLHELEEMGVQLALDDFGTGYSSLSYLRRFPIHQLKIDKSFVRDVPLDTNASSIVTTIIALSEAMGMGVIAEGVETPAQSAFLQRHGCLEQQGFHFARPQELNSMRAMLNASALAPPPLATGA